MSTNEDATRKPTSPSIYAAFAVPAEAERAASALVESGVRAEDISLVVNDKDQPDGNKTLDDRELEWSQPTLYSGPAGATGRFDPLGNDLRTSTPTPIQGGNLFPVGESAQMDLNPAQIDYPVENLKEPTAFSSRPADANSDYNAGLDARDYNKDYDRNVERESRDEAIRDVERQSADGLVGAEVNVADAPLKPTPVIDAEDPRTAAQPSNADASGVHHETISDAANTATKSVVAGLGVGALAALTAIAVPGVGLVLGGGALALAIAGLAAGASSGQTSGGVVSYLKDHGVPANDIPRYQQIYDAGGAVMCVQVDDMSDREGIEQILNQAGAVKVDRYGYAA